MPQKRVQRGGKTGTKTGIGEMGRSGAGAKVSEVKVEVRTEKPIGQGVFGWSDRPYAA